MPNCLSVEKKWYPVRSVRSEAGDLVPWEVAGYFEDFENSKHGAGFFDLSHWQLIEMTGPDAGDYLQRMSTANLKKLEDGRVRFLAFLTGKANPVVFGQVVQLAANRFWLLFPGAQAQNAIDHIEKFHFAENFECRMKASAVLAILATPDWTSGLSWLGPFPKNSHETVSIASTEYSGVFWRDEIRPNLFWVTIEDDGSHSAMESLVDQLMASGAKPLGHKLFEHLRISAAIPEVGKEISDREIFLEGGFEPGVARNKGCYPGQEVIERIFTYGQVNKKLLPLEFTSSNSVEPQLPFAIHCGDQTALVVAYSPSPDHPGRAVGLAYVGKQNWESKEAWQGPGGLTAKLAVF